MIMGGRVDDGCFPSFSLNIRFLMVEQNMALKIRGDRNHRHYRYQKDIYIYRYTY